MPKRPKRSRTRSGEDDAWHAFQAELQRTSLVTLLDFAQADIDALPVAKRQHLLAAMRSFVGEIGLLVDSTGESNVVTTVPTLSMEQVRSLQQPLRDGLESLYPSGVWRPPLQWAPPLAVEAIEIARGSREFGLIYVVAWPDAFWFAALKLLEHYGTSVRRCARCGRLFIRTKRQEYCTPACSQNTRSQRWYESHRDDVLERRHESYLAAHPKRKIPRRRRHRRVT